MSATARQAQDQQGLAERLGIKPGQVVQEIGYDDDCDEQLREAITRLKDTELVDEDYDDVGAVENEFPPLESEMRRLRVYKGAHTYQHQP